MNVARDACLELPLDGVQAIEASAGTGKTFALATLVVRLVVERGLRIEHILAVTFTEAATQELRARIRARLLLAVSLADAAAGQETPEAALTRAILDAHVARSGESRDALRRRLRVAAEDIDLASVFTIHGFCARVLREHALESGHGFGAPELLANDAPLRQQIAADLWRAQGAADEAADDLLALWKGGPNALAADLSPLLREDRLQPAFAGTLPPDPASALHAAGEALAAAFHVHGRDFRDALLAAVNDKVLHAGSYKADWIVVLFDALGDWAAAGDPDAPFAHEKLPQLRREMLRLRTNKDGTGRTPDSPLCDAVDDYLQAQAGVEAYREARRIALLHRLRDDARARLALRKRQLRVQSYDDLIDGVADALDGPHADLLARRLREQYRIALVDEFQDTDPRQWRIFDRVFGVASDAPALFVIGDPKQAIYGFRGGDVETYLAARDTAVAAPPLSHNFRSRPSLLRAIEALYAQAGDTAFVDERIRFHQVQPGGTRSDHDYLHDGAPAPALTLWQTPQPPPDTAGKVKPWNASASRELATVACVAAIHRVLTDARAGKASIDGSPVQPGDIAVLVRTHRDATRIRQALAEVGIAAVATGKLSLFATPEARELHALLRMLAQGADDGHLRTALSTVLLGVDAAGIAALDTDGDAMRHWHLRVQDWRERLQRGGPLALVNDLCAEHAPRLLGLFDGERRLTNYLQLAENLQEADARSLGLSGLVDWLANAIAGAGSGEDDDTRQLRLESDACRVQIVTLHKSKGLEYPLVFLPYAGIGGKPPDPGQCVVVTGDGGRALHWKLQVAASGWDEARTQWLAAQRAEDARLLYVGLTRARDALWLATGPFYNHAQSPLAPMLRDAAALADSNAGIVIDTAPTPSQLPRLLPEREHAVLPARIATRPVAADWWVYSFTQLAHADAGHVTEAAATEADGAAADEAMQSLDEFEAPADAVIEAHDPRFAGSRFGNALHDALENADFAAWAGWRPGEAAPAGEQAVLLDALRKQGYAQDDLHDGQSLLASLVGRTLTISLPEGGALHVLGASERRAEIEFHFALKPTAVSELLALLHAHGLVRARQGFGLRSRLEGLMTGKIDLTYVRDGRWYVLDYKSNRLPRYDAPALAAAMAHSEYDLQALIYTLALHRWLRFRLGTAYDYARDFGGIRYLFCRGLDPAKQPSPGVHAQRFAPELVHALDVLFAGATQEAAA
ncbi:exodeoxyribonuclease V subunit beta [Pseudoxanthomonas kalamensis DSM 18571]|uniref:UvrD-helicase domain-containing protein n=1 Tax=Pseudoxanthomonas kalamensis TaxID=289483 RepID=UPI0013909080|nr:exodeoxyribonuclease V subunit beta [Pseudoxanthomonas kalamensis]KAF1712299.1 exodeoxyribonuclease V subunit beta [Pseudoxanthomonas kalamensis DSM 18571]